MPLCRPHAFLPWVFCAVLVGCIDHSRPVPANIPVASTPHALAREFVDYVQQEKWVELYQCMERAYRDANSARDLEAAYVQMVTWYGKPLRFDYKGESAGHFGTRGN